VKKQTIVSDDKKGAIKNIENNMKNAMKDFLNKTKTDGDTPKLSKAALAKAKKDDNKIDTSSTVEKIDK